MPKLKKMAAGKLVPSLSMGGLTGLTALEGSHAFDKTKSKKERVMAGAGAAATGSILASEAIHNQPWKWIKRAKAEMSLADGALSIFKTE